MESQLGHALKRRIFRFPPWFFKRPHTMQPNSMGKGPFSALNPGRLWDLSFLPYRGSEPNLNPLLAFSKDRVFVPLVA